MSDSSPQHVRGTLGSLESLGLPEIVQSLALGKKTARLSLTSGKRWGHIWFEDGVAKHARTGQKFGELAFYEMVSWKTGEFLLEPGVCSETQSLDHDPMFLIMEGSRRLDESRADAPNDSPPPVQALETIPLSVPRDTDAASPAGLPLPKLTLRRGKPGTAPVAPPRSRTGSARPGRWLAAAMAPMFIVALVLVVRAFLEPDPVRAVPRVPPPEPSRSPPTQGSEDGGMTPDSETNPPVTNVEPDDLADSGTPEPLPLRPEPLEPPTPVPEAVSDVPAELDLDASETAEVEPLPVAEELDPAYLRIFGKSNVQAGMLVIHVDGDAVYTRTLATAPGKAKRFFKRMIGRAGESFEAVIRVEPGEHEILAEVTVADEASGYDSRLSFDVDPGATHEVRLVAGRKRDRPLILEAD